MRVTRFYFIPHYIRREEHCTVRSSNSKGRKNRLGTNVPAFELNAIKKMFCNFPLDFEFLLSILMLHVGHITFAVFAAKTYFTV